MKFKSRVLLALCVSCTFLSLLALRFLVHSTVTTNDVQSIVSPDSDYMLYRPRTNQMTEPYNSEWAISKEEETERQLIDIRNKKDEADWERRLNKILPINLDRKKAAKPKSSTSNFSSRLTYVRRPSSWECPHLLRPENVLETFQFQQVDGLNDTFLYSAFLDKRDAVVRIISIVSRSVALYRCLLWYDVTDDTGGVASQDLSISSARITTIPESHGRK